MTHLGASGDTKSEIATALGINEVDNVNELFKEMRSILTNPKNKYILREANRLYGDREVSFKEDFLNKLKEFHDAPLEPVTFNEQTRLDINDWVANKTEQKIKDLLHAGDLDSAILVLINAIYFKAIWLSPFQKSKTKPGEFEITSSKTVTVDMMERSGHYKSLSSAELSAKIIEIPYQDRNVNMYILLPDDVSGLCDLQSRLTADRLNDAIEGLELDFVKLYLPRFEMNYRVGLKGYLVKYMPLLFGPTAELSAISDDSRLSVSDVIHQTFVRVGENGTEAAAATAVILVKTAAVISDKEVKVDHPFIFLIRDTQTQSVLFLGRVVDPSGKENLSKDDGYTCVGLSDVSGSAAEILSYPLVLILGIISAKFFAM